MDTVAGQAAARVCACRQVGSGALLHACRSQPHLGNLSTSCLLAAAAISGDIMVYDAPLTWSGSQVRSMNCLSSN